ncbi:hypothetical protein AURDEDRAFT_175298 [Auricularia subglabra TFB-10046 SS5]|uniref:F-box domain-containing protein n=1 Tax=Auricularia subglabra (strain TFB-10046 / SS5) TaxID=717982 RepID=J0WS52_AURST|nr:hypothetical protein AURDEDRAFT_175298 [Auricularia subglabra TFB-10046 SS5]
MTSDLGVASHAFPGRSLPVELMTMILDDVDLPSLLRLSHTCRRWRSVSRSHPRFWRDIRLASVSTSALDLFHARLDQTTDSDIHVDIMLPDALDHGRIRSVVLPAVGRNLHRIVESQIMLHYETATYALYAFMGAASRLQRFALGFFHGADKPPVQLPTDILSGHCPSLRLLTLKNAAFPKDPILSFGQVHHLLFGCDGPYVFPLCLFQHFPSLRVLSVHGGMCLGAEPVGEAAREVTIPQLATFAVHIADCDHLALFGAVPRLSEIARVTCREPHVDLMRVLLDHLHGPLELDIVVPGVREDQIEVGFSTPSSDRSRVFVEDSTRIHSDWPRDIVFAPDVAERVTALRLTTKLAWLVPLFAELPACTTLAVEVGDMVDLAVEFTATLALPALKSIIVRGRPEQGPVSVSAEALREFLLRILGTRTAQPTLRIEESLTLTGDSRALMRDYGVESEDEPPAPVSCPLLQELALHLCAYALPANFRVDVDAVARFLDTQVAVAQPPALACQPILRVDDRAQLTRRVKRMEDMYPGAR